MVLAVADKHSGLDALVRCYVMICVFCLTSCVHLSDRSMTVYLFSLEETQVFSFVPDTGHRSLACWSSAFTAMDLQTASRSRHVRANFLPLTLVSTNCCNAVGVLLLVSSVVSLILSNHHSYGAGRRLNSTERYGNESGGRSIAVARAPLTPPAERRESEDPSNGSARSWGESGDEDAADEGHEDQPDRAAGTWRQRRSQNPILYGYSNRRTQNAVRLGH